VYVADTMTVGDDPSAASRDICSTEVGLTCATATRAERRNGVRRRVSRVRAQDRVRWDGAGRGGQPCVEGISDMGFTELMADVGLIIVCRSPSRTLRLIGARSRGRLASMARLEELTKGALVLGVLAERSVKVVDVAWHGSGAITLTYTDDLTGRADQEFLYRDDEPRLTVEQVGRAWSMDADGQLFRLASEAERISLAYLFDPFLAVQTSNLEPLPHQIDAVYGKMKVTERVSNSTRADGLVLSVRFLILGGDRCRDAATLAHLNASRPRPCPYIGGVPAVARSSGTASAAPCFACVLDVTIEGPAHRRGVALG
jgi:hypothetical protein